MGSSFAPVLANIFMGFYESKWLEEYILNKPKFSLRYVDDILDKSDVHYFKLSYIRNLSHHIKNKLSKLCKEFYVNLLVLALVLAILVKIFVILKLGLRSISKRISSLIYLNIYTFLKHALAHIILFVWK